jgi:hypothetical protein
MVSPIAGAYITFSELFDRQPTVEEVTALLKDLSMMDASVLLSRMNLSLRFAMQEQNRPNFARIQQMLYRDFTDDEIFRRLSERFPNVSPSDRPIFTPIDLLNLLRLVLRYSSGPDDPGAVDNSALRFALGRACLMMNNLLLSAEEERTILKGDPDKRRFALMVQLLAPFELANPPAAHHLFFRFGVMYRMLIKDQNIRDRIASECSGFDFETEFERLTGISLERWLYIVFAIYSYFLYGGNILNFRLEFTVLKASAFPVGSGITEDELRATLRTISTSITDVQTEMRADLATDPRFDFISFRSKPLVGVYDDRFAPIDAAFVLEKLHTGVQWTIHDGLPIKKRNSLFQAWGVLFEEYVHWLFGRSRTDSTYKYVPRPSWRNGEESFDGMLLKDSVLVPMEYKGGFLSRAARYSGREREFADDMKLKFIPGCSQLASKIRTLFTADERKRGELQDVRLDHIRSVLPVLILQDQILRTPFLNWWLNKTFQAELQDFKPRPDIVVRPLTVVSVNELETMLDSADAEDFDFIYALHHRTVRDPDVLSSLQEWLLQFPNYGRQRSERTKKILEEVKGPLFSYLFPKSTAGDS